MIYMLIINKKIKVNPVFHAGIKGVIIVHLSVHCGRSAEASKGARLALGSRKHFCKAVCHTQDKGPGKEIELSAEHIFML